jgi:hypothetical protein
LAAVADHGMGAERITRFSSLPLQMLLSPSSGHSCCSGRPSAALSGKSSRWARPGLSDCTTPWLSTAATPVGMCCSTAFKCRRLAISIRWLSRMPRPFERLAHSVFAQ